MAKFIHTIDAVLWNRTQLFVAIGVIVILHLALGNSNFVLSQNSRSIEKLPLNQIFVPPPRELVRPLVRAQRAIKEKDYRQAAELLGEILTTVEQEDYLKPLDDRPFIAVSIHREAQRLLGSIPKKHRADYELKYSVTAEQMLRDAVERGDFDQMARTCRHYFFTPAGYTAAMLLGHHYLEKGHPVSAAAYFSPIVEHPDARADNDPEASIMLATCWMLSRSTDKAKQVLVNLHKRYPAGHIDFLGKNYRLFDKKEDALSWLSELIGTSSIGGYGPVNEWLVYRGNTQRNAESGTGFPLAFPRWLIPTINDPHHEQLVHQVLEKRLANGEIVIPSLQPLAIGDTVVMRSADRMIGIDFKTGKRLWVFPAWYPESMLGEDEEAEEFRRSQTTEWHLEQRIWQDHLYGQISSDGELVFVVDRPGFAGRALDNAVLGRGRVIDHPLGVRDTNELKAIELDRQGAFRWEIGGTTGGSEPQLAGCFFLGPPLPLRGELYALCEIAGEIRLVVLDPQTGSLNWSQQIAAIDSTMPVNKDSMRRLAGATPSFSDGILICPTSASGLVAIELATRSLLWGVRYPTQREELLAKRNFSRIEVPRFDSDGSNLPIDSTVTIADGRVIFMPVESNQVICVDLLTGKPLWSEQYPQIGVPREGSLFIACVANQQAILVGKNNIRSLDIKNGRQRWKLDLESEGQPSGHGFTTSGFYYLPTTHSKILKIDLNNGSLAGSVETDRILGNLVCYAGNVIAQGSDVVSVYRQAEPTRLLVERELKSGDVSAEILVLKAQLDAQAGDIAAATETAHRAYEKSTSDSNLRLLVGLILDYMNSDYIAAQRYVEQYAEQLVSHRKHEFLAAQMQGLIVTNQRDRAIELLITLANEGHDISSDNQGKTVFRTADHGALQLRLDHWLRWRFTNLLDHSDPEDSDAEDSDPVLVSDSADQPASWLKDRAGDLSLDGVAKIADWYGVDRVPPGSLLEMAESLIRKQEYLLAERSLKPLVQSVNSPFRGRAIALYCKLLSESGWQAQAYPWAEMLLDQFADQTVYRDESGQQLTGEDFHQRYLGSLAEIENQPMTWDSWSYGHVSSELKRTDSKRLLSYRMILYPQCISLDDLAPQDIKVNVDINTYQLTIHNSQGKELGPIDFKVRESIRQVYYRRDQRMSGVYSLHGHLLLFSLGYDLVAIDLFQLNLGQDAVLWRKSLSRPTNQMVDQLRNSRMPRQVDNPWGNDWYLFFDRDGNEIGGFATDGQRVFYQKADSIVCANSATGDIVWKRAGLSSKCKLLASGKHVIALTATKNSYGKYESAMLLVSDTGTLIDNVDISALKKQTLWSAAGARLLFFEHTRKDQSMTSVDVRTGETIWTRSYAKNTFADFRDFETLAVYSTDGTFELLDLKTGQPIVDLQLNQLQAKSLEVVPMHDNDLIILNRNSRTTTRASSKRFGATLQALGTFESLVDGYVYCIDRKTNLLRWDSPIRIESFWIPKTQPAGLPILTFARAVTKSAQGLSYDFFSVDLRDGRLVNVFRKQNLPFRAFSLEAVVEDQTITMKFGTSQLDLKLSDAEVPPSAPASLTNEFTLAGNISANLPATRSADDIKKQQQTILERLIKSPPDK